LTQNLSKLTIISGRQSPVGSIGLRSAEVAPLADTDGRVIVPEITLQQQKLSVSSSSFSVRVVQNKETMIQVALMSGQVKADRCTFLGIEFVL
jgi:hypothetical protein